MLHSLKPVKNTTNLTANLTEASMLTPITSTKNKTNLMEASMLNTLKTNVILTRAVLIALFAGLFILAACGGGGGAATPVATGDPVVNPCDANPFGPTCTRDVDAAARTMEITNCATSIDTDASDRAVDCAIVPLDVVYCLDDPRATSGTRACDAAAYDTARQGSGVTLSEVRNTRVILCRDDSNRNETLCNSTVVQRCGDDANPFDLVCGRLNPARNAIIEKCVDSATLADSTKNADCVAARVDAGFTCFDDPWAESCLTSTMYREFASFRADAQTSRLTYCLGDDADAGVCGPALARICVDSGAGANPFHALCTATAYNSVRADFATNCFNGENNGANCAVTAFELPRTGGETLCGNGDDIPGSEPMNAMCMTTPVTVASCASAPFSTNCRSVATFAGARTALFGICTNGVVDDKDSFCDADGNNNGGFTADEITCLENPFTTGGSVDCGMLFTALGGTVADAQNTLITACTTGADADMNENCNAGDMTGAVAVCLDNPFTTGCDTTLGTKTQADVARANLIETCTGDGADGTNMRCTIEGQTLEILLLTDCLRDPFVVDCDTALGATHLMTAQSNVLALCTAEGSDALTTNRLCTDIARGGTDNNGNRNVKTCLNNPFTVGTMLLGATTTNCETVLGGTDAVTRAQANLIALCTGADADGANALCTIAKDTVLTAALTVALKACLADPFRTGCDTELGDSLTTAQSNVIALCAGDAISTNALCMGLGGDVKTCIDDPFTPNADNGINCGTSLGTMVRDDLQSDIVALCTGDDADDRSNPRCATAATTSDCLTNPFDATASKCSDQLGATLLATAKSNVIALCTGDDALAATNALCTSAAAVVTCLTNPFDESDNGSCAGAAEIADLTALQNNRYEYCLTDMPDATLCTTDLYMTEFCSATSTNANANIFHANCDDVPTINDASGGRATYCTANPNDDNCSSMTACGTNPFGTTCFFDGNRYDDDRATAITDCDATATSPVDPDCADVIVEASDPANNITVGSCKANPFLAGCEIADFDDARSSAFDACEGVTSNRESDPLCMPLIIKAEVTGQNAADAVTVASCIAEPFGADCTNDVFDATRTASFVACNNNADHNACDQVIIAEDMTNSVTEVNVATCIGNPFASGCDTLDVFADKRDEFQNDCALAVDKTNQASCLLPVGSTTVNGCRNDPFQTDCVSFDAFAGDKCIARPFDTDCAAETYDTARENACTSPTASNYNVFNVNCTETAYTGTDEARKTFADECRAGTATRGCDVAVSGATNAPTIAACNTNPYATGCDTTIFADALTAYCADGATTIFNTNCDSRTDIATARRVSIGACIAALTTNKDDASCTGREIVAEVPEVPAIIAGTTMVDHDDNPATPDIVARPEDASDAIPAVPAVTVGVCLDDPFNTGCASDLFDFARADHMEVCMSNGNANLPSCTNINTGDTTYQTCLRNPFDTTCTGSTGHRFRNARAARYAFCEGPRAGSAAMVATGDTDLCGSEGSGGTGTTIRGEICSYAGGAEGERLNPFAGVCADNTYVSSKRYYCGVGGRRNSEAGCMDTPTNSNSINTDDGCLANPFSATCTADLPQTGATITAELRTFLTTQRMAYCTAVDAEGFDETLCRTTGGVDNALDSDVDFASVVCEGLGEDANPFAPFCVRKDNEFDADRVEFVEACGALTGGATRLGANADGATCASEVIACYAAPFVAGTDATDCINEPAYAMARQSVVDLCVAAVADPAVTAADNADCMTIAGVGQLTCITTNPYLNRAEATSAGVTTPALNCADNSNYDTLRNTLETVTCLASGTPGDARCGVLVANVCGTGADDTAVVGTNPFNANYCFAQDNTFDTQRKTLIDSCDGTSTENGCTAEINACVKNPFATSLISTTGVETCQDISVAKFFAARKITYCGLESTDGTANISLGDCQTLATTNPCVANPFGEFATSVACADTHVGGAIADAQTLRTTYCSALGTTSLAIRTDGTDAYCRGAVDNFCKDDKLFATATGTDMFNCLTDTNYNTARAAHAGLCDGDLASRNGVECGLATAEICTTLDGLQTNPWAPICSEGGASATSAQQMVINACLAKGEGTGTDQRGENVATNVCIRTIDDSASPVANNDVVEILATCGADPRDAACDNFASIAGEGFTDARATAFAENCSAVSAMRTGRCEVELVKALICVDSGDNARPFASICGEGDDITDLDARRRAVLLSCLTLDNSGDAHCLEENAPTTRAVTSAIVGVCGGDGATDNPFGMATGITGITGDLDCTDYSLFDATRTRFTESCRDAGASSDYNPANCNKGGVIAAVCETPTGVNANPFSNACTVGSNTNVRKSFAASCVGGTPDVAISVSNLAECPQTVINCANNPFTPTTCDDAGYDLEKEMVLGLCDTDAEIVSDTTGRCAPALDDVRCLKDPFGTCEGTDLAQLNFVAGGDGGALFTTLKTNRQLTCRGGDLVNSQKNICRTAHTATAACLRNPFGNCTTELGAGNLSDYRTNRLAYCRNSANADQTSISNTNTATISDTDVNLCNAPSTEIDAAGVICGSISDSTFALVAGLDNMRDPFIAACLQITDYNDERSNRITNCSTAAFDQTTWACDYAAQATYCDESTAPDGCLARQAPNVWRESLTTGTFALWRNVDTSKNQLVTDFKVGPPPAATLYTTISSAVRIEDTAVPNISVTFTSGQKAAVAAGRFVTQTDVDNDTNNATMSVIVGGVPRAAVAGDIGVTPITEAVDAGAQRFYAGIDATFGNVGAPVFDRSVNNAVWTGKIHWIGVGDDVNSNTSERVFKMSVDYDARTIEGAINVDNDITNGLGRHIVIDGNYTAAGIITGVAYGKEVTGTAYTPDTPNINAIGGTNGSEGSVSGIIGSKAAVGAFIGPDIVPGTVDYSFGGGFIVTPPSN